MSSQGGPNPQMSMPQGGRISPWDDNIYTSRVFFTYEADIPVALAAGLGTTLTFNVAGDSDFFWTKFAAFALVGSDGTTASSDNIPGVSMLLINTTTGRQYSSSAVPLGNMAGNGRFPFILPQITMWPKKSTIQIQLQNLTDNTAYSNLMLSFMGIKAFPRS